MNGLIVATFNPICHSGPVDHGTFFKGLIHSFLSVKAKKASSLHTIILETKHK